VSPYFNLIQRKKMRANLAILINSVNLVRATAMNPISAFDDGSGEINPTVSNHAVLQLP